MDFIQLHKDAHFKSDLNFERKSQHHTLGYGSLEAAPGIDVKPIDPIAVTAFDGGSTWANFGGAEPVAAYGKIGRRVQLQGVIAGGVLTATAFTLPVEYRPSVNMRFPVSSVGAFGMVYVQTDGKVIPFNGNPVSFDLSPITFIAKL